MVARIDKAYPPAARRPVGAGVPGVVIDGVVKTAANIDPEWVDFDADERLEKRLKRPVFMVNDADAAGVAEMRLKASASGGSAPSSCSRWAPAPFGHLHGRLSVPNSELVTWSPRARRERRSAAVARTGARRGRRPGQRTSTSI